MLDANPRDALILANINLARMIAWPMAMRVREISAEDFLQDAMEALVRLAGDFDPAREVPFDAYVKTMLPLRLLNKIRRYDQTPTPTKVHKYRNAQETLTQSLMREPTTAEIAERMGVTAGTVRRIRGFSETHEVSFGTLASTANTEATVLDSLQVAAIEEAVSRLGSRDQDIVKLCIEGESQHDIARRLGLSSQRISQLVGRIRSNVAASVGA